MKILIIINAMAKGGAEKLIEITAPLFHARNNDVTVFLLDRNRSIPEYIQTLKDAGVHVVFSPYKSVYSPLQILAIKKLLKQNTFDVVHVHLFPASYFTAFARILSKPKTKQTPFFFTEHSTENKRRNKFVFKLSEKIVYKQFNRIVAITEEVKNNLDKWLGYTDKSTVIYNGVHIQAIQNQQKWDREALCESLNVPEYTILLLMAASFRYPKNQAAIIEALKDLPEEVHLLLAGEGEKLEEVKQKSIDLKLSQRVHFLGFRNDVTRLMKSVDFNILSSFYEGMSGVTLEGMASGVAFLGAEVSGIKDIVPDQRFLFPSDDSKTLSEKIKYLLQHPEEKKQMEKDALEFVQQFDIDIMVNKYLDLYQQSLSDQEQ